MTKLEQYALEKHGIRLTKYQLDLIRAWCDGKTIISPKAAGKTTAVKIVRAYVGDSL